MSICVYVSPAGERCSRGSVSGFGGHCAVHGSDFARVWTGQTQPTPELLAKATTAPTLTADEQLTCDFCDNRRAPGSSLCKYHQPSVSKPFPVAAAGDAETFRCCVFTCDRPARKGSRTCEDHAPKIEDTEVARLRDEIVRLKSLLHRDATGLAEGLTVIRDILKSYGWIAANEWGSYDYKSRTQQTLRREIGFCLDAVDTVANEALRRSGQRADSAFGLKSPPYETPLGLAPLQAENKRLRAKLARIQEMLGAAEKETRT